MRLPDRLPVLARPCADGGYDIQIGLARPTVLRDLGAEERAFLSSLEGGRSVSSAEAMRYPRVVAALSGVWRGRSQSLPSAEIAIHGCGALGLMIAQALGAGGWGLALHDESPVGVEPSGTFPSNGAGTCAGASVQILADRGIAARLGTPGDCGPSVAHLTVLVVTGAPDPPTVARLLNDGTPHILVACDEARVLVSHVVVPGRTACSRCRDIALTRTDSAWPYLAAQLAGSHLPTRRPRAPRIAGPATAARVATRAAGWFDASEPGVAEEVRPNGEVTQAPIVPEPECGCGAAGPVGDEVAAKRAQWSTQQLAQP